MPGKPPVLVTGAAGRLCRKLIPDLIEEGFGVRALDLRKMDYDTDCIYGSVTDYGTVRSNAQWMHTVVHTANLHAAQLPFDPSRTEAYETFYDVNVTGTKNVLRACLAAGVKKLVYLSSVGWYGDLGGVVDETMGPRDSAHYYGLTKQLCEQQCRFYAYNHDIEVVILRPGFFSPKPEITWSFLMNRVHRDDVARATRLAMDYEPEDGCEAFNINSGVPFVSEDNDQLIEEPLEVVDRYWPGAAEVLREHDVEPSPITRTYRIDKAREKLGYEPEWTFEGWLREMGWTGESPMP
jgi:nucleoside-diphosphate-sugar epimerase